MADSNPAWSEDGKTITDFDAFLEALTRDDPEAQKALKELEGWFGEAVKNGEIEFEVAPLRIKEREMSAWPPEVDSKGFARSSLPPKDSLWLHKNGFRYVVFAHVWISDTDEWGVALGTSDHDLPTIAGGSRFFEPGRFTLVDGE